MAYLGNIVNLINVAIGKKLTAFPTAKYYGLTYPVTIKEGKVSNTLPGIIDINGEVTEITFNDIAELCVYHRISSSSYSQNKEDSYGDVYDLFQHNYEIDLIVMSNRKKVNVQPDSLEAAIASNIPSNFSLQSFPGIEFINIVTVSANHASKSLFTQEYAGATYFLKPEHIYFSIRYRIELRYRKGCISLCQCN